MDQDLETKKITKTKLELRGNDFKIKAPVTGSVAPVHHTAWSKAMDDSSETFLNKN